MKKFSIALIFLLAWALLPALCSAQMSGLMPGFGQKADKAPESEMPANKEAPAAEQITLEIPLVDTGANRPSLFERMEKFANQAQESFAAFSQNIPLVPGDLKRVMDKLSDGRGGLFLVWVIGVVFLVLGAGFTAETLLFRKRFTKKIDNLAISGPMTPVQKFWTALIRILFSLLSLAVFVVFCLALYGVLLRRAGWPYGFVLSTALSTVLYYRVFAAVLRAVLSPGAPDLRPVALKEEGATALYNGCRLAFGVMALAIGCFFLKGIGLSLQSFMFLACIFMAGFLLVFAVMAWKQRKQVALAICAGGEGEPSWLREQIATVWHILVMAYLAVIYLVWAVRMIASNDIHFRGTVYLSLFIVPIYLVLDKMGQWAVDLTSHTLASSEAKEKTARGEKEESGDTVELCADPDGEGEQPKAGYVLLIKKAVRGLIVFSLVLILLESWGLHLPFAEAIAGAVFNILVTLLLANLAWSAICRAIERKLAETAPDEDEQNEEDDGDWGAAASLDRSHTILPRLKAFLGAVLVTVVAMIILSSMGVEIGPLLAGAGVAGIAIGFGAQKVVADVISGIFFLVDDAFRIGEYIEAGGVSGAVEDITLRNVMLRHHRGMLQIVPFSDLGSVTNFMRGGIVVKFNLELPYDTDIDKVRKIIKKTGKKMLEDPEMGPDFIKPVKSQGVREVGNSVMVIRVKFTAKPGTHFVIRREAYRLITEALASKGIHYAHRKVLVDIPQPENGQAVPEETLAAAGAAAMRSIEEDENQAKKK